MQMLKKTRKLITSSKMPSQLKYPSEKLLLLSVPLEIIIRFRYLIFVRLSSEILYIDNIENEKRNEAFDA